MSGREVNKIYTSDTKMLTLIDILKAYNKIRFDKEFCDAIGLIKQNLNNIKNGSNHFTPDHIEKAVKIFDVDANWIFGISDNIFRGYKKTHTHTQTIENINTPV